MREKKQVKLNQQQLMDAYSNERAKLDASQQKQRGLQNALSEILTTQETLKEMEKAKKDESVLVSLGSGIYAEAKMGALKEVKTSLPANIMLDSSLENAQKKLKEEKQKVEKALIATTKDTQITMQNVQNFEKVFAQMRQANAQQATPPIEGATERSVS